MSTFDNLVDRIKAAARDGSRPHTLIVAPRGAGKTHTLHVAVHRSIADPGTSKSVMPVFIPEDALAIGSYIDLLVEIARSIDDDLAETTRDMRRQKDTIGIEQAIIAAAGSRMILLAIENLDRVFDSLGQGGQGALRAWVETSTAITIFATSPMLFAGVSSRSYPWYGSFIVETLPELTVDEGVEMLNRAARRRGDDALASFIESATGHERLQVIHRLAGGSPRLWHILSDGVDVKSLDALVPAVESLLDRLAPYYQQQLWQLPTGEQRLVVELARGWEPRTVSDLAASVGISNQSAATALGRLASTRWVTSSKAESGDRRASWYDLTEPLLRYHLQYREDRGKPLRLIVEFLRGFYSAERMMTELAAATADSPLERHLQIALRGSDPFRSPDTDDSDFTMLIARLRVWIADEEHDLASLATVLESVACAAVRRQPERPLPDELRAVTTAAVAAVDATAGSAADRLQAGMNVVAGQKWPVDAVDARIWIELLWGTDDFEEKAAKLEASPAVQQRRTTDLAIAQRILLARTRAHLRGPSGGQQARETLDDLLDDLDSTRATAHHGARSGWVATAWGCWAEVALSSPPLHPRRVGHTLEAAAGFVTAMKSGDIPASDLPTILAALDPVDRGPVAAQAALAARIANLELPNDLDPLDYLDRESRIAITRVVDDFGENPEQAVENAIRAVTPPESQP